VVASSHRLSPRHQHAVQAALVGKSGDYIVQGGRLMMHLPDAWITLYPTSDDAL
jgi:hypothetical protein